MSDYDMSIHSSTDAMKWTEFFFKTYPNCNVDREAMFGWFANAMMAMYDAMDSKKGKVMSKYKNKINVDVYLLKSTCSVQIGNKWVDGIIYFNENKHREMYVRTKDDFFSSFEEIIDEVEL